MRQSDDAKEAFCQRAREWAERLDVGTRAIHIRPMHRKWAPCSTAGTLSFNEELLSFDREVWDYVIVHELLHFFVPNHGRLWKSLMRAHLGDYEPAANRLNDLASGEGGG